MTNTLNSNNFLDQWIGKTETNEDYISAGQANLMCATMGLLKTLKKGDELPALWHWIYFLSAKVPNELGLDGHPKLGGFLPPVKLPMRMWAGGRFVFYRPIKIGDVAIKKSKVEAIKHKQGKTSDLCFITVSHSIFIDDQICIREEHDIVYKNAPKTNDVRTPIEPPKKIDWHRKVITNPTLLFRYSALTFNGHRIHYDREYAKTTELYPNLVVHGPLIATLLANFSTEKLDKQTLKSFEFKALAPIFDQAPFYLNARHNNNIVNLWASDVNGGLALKAKATFKV